MEEALDFLIGYYRGVPAWSIGLEAIALVFGLVSVWYAQRAKVLVYPTGLISTTITVYLLWEGGLLGDMMMNLYYSGMSIYGWYNWNRTRDQIKIVTISRASRREWVEGIGLMVITAIMTYGVYVTFRNEPLDWTNHVDILTSGIFFTGMWFMATKKIENWTLWIIGDLISVPLYAYRGYGLFAVQYAVFTIMAIQGYRQWNRILQEEGK